MDVTLREARTEDIPVCSEICSEAFTNLSGVRDVTIEDGVLSCTILGTVDTLIKAAAQFEVVKVVSHEPSLEDMFLSYYSGSGNCAE